MVRNYLKGAAGDHINLLMAACAWYLNKWLLAIYWLFFAVKNKTKIGLASGNFSKYLFSGTTI